MAEQAPFQNPPDPCQPALPRLRVLVSGIGDVASAVALTLWRQGLAVVIHCSRAPLGIRRGMAFIDAAYDGVATLEDGRARCVENLPAVQCLLEAGAEIPVCRDCLDALIAAWKPEIFVEGRMYKHEKPAPLRGLAPFTLGLGPNFSAPDIVDCAVETAWGDDLGKPIFRGGTLPLFGEPRPLGGIGRERFIYAPRDGVVVSTRHIGERVSRGETVAELAGAPLAAPFDGWLRGLIRGGAAVRTGMKLIEIDPRDDCPDLFGMGERPRRVAAGVLAAVRARFGHSEGAAQR